MKQIHIRFGGGPAAAGPISNESESKMPSEVVGGEGGLLEDEEGSFYNQQ